MPSPGEHGSSTALGMALVEAGLIQFGRFVQDDGTAWPVQFRLEWLASYPRLLATVADTVASHPFVADVDRLLTTHQAIAPGVAVGLARNIPVTFPLHRTGKTGAAWAIEGAYDVGHPTLLLANVIVGGAQARRIAALAGRVGLNVQAVLAIVDAGAGGVAWLRAKGYAVDALLQLDRLVEKLAEAGQLPFPLIDTVHCWQREMRASTS